MNIIDQKSFLNLLNKTSKLLFIKKNDKLSEIKYDFINKKFEIDNYKTLDSNNNDIKIILNEISESLKILINGQQKIIQTIIDQQNIKKYQSKKENNSIIELISEYNKTNDFNEKKNFLKK